MVACRLIHVQHTGVLYQAKCGMRDYDVCFFFFFFFFFFFQADDGIRYLVRSRGIGDEYNRQDWDIINKKLEAAWSMTGEPVLSAEKKFIMTAYF